MPASRWLFGAAPDLLLGCGLGWGVAFLAQGAIGSDALAAWVPAGLLVMFSSIPHYGATLLRVYESADDRRKYSFFAVHASIALAILFAFGLYSAWLGSLLLTIYLTWSPWHYSGQNYGIALMLLRRRGVQVEAGTKRWLYASFVLSFALTVVAIHGVVDTANYAPVTYSGAEFRPLKLGIPAAASNLLVPALAIGYLASLVAAGVGLVGRGRPRDLLPALLLVATQGLWFALPVVLRHGQVVGPDSFFAHVLTPYGFIWIATAHAIQYLWVTSYFARTSRSDARLLPYLGKAALAGYAIWTLPALLFAPGLLGQLPYESGLALLTAAMVNLHHFILDGAIWKLRDGRIARVLLRDNAEATPSPGATAFGGNEGQLGGRRWLPGLAWAGGALSIAVALVAFYEDDFGHRAALERRDLHRVRVAAERLAWIGRDGPTIHRELGRSLLQGGQAAAARRAFQRSLELYPTAGAWLDLASLEENQGDLEQALESLEQALELDPDNAQTLYRAGRLHLKRGEPGRAVSRLERAAELAPDEGLVRVSLERARRLAGIDLNHP